ncbi:MAG: hypothetical protein AAGA30_14395, partial [Planctomycetota bacterium]
HVVAILPDWGLLSKDLDGGKLSTSTVLDTIKMIIRFTVSGIGQSSINRSFAAAFHQTNLSGFRPTENENFRYKASIYEPTPSRAHEFDDGAI